MSSLTESSDIYKIDPNDVITRLQSLPTLSAVVVDLLNCVDQEALDIGTLAAKVSHDQALTARTLRFANSSFFGSRAKVTTISQAISLLGLQSIRHLIMATALSGHFPENHCQGFDSLAFWRHSIATAVCCKIIARHLHLNQDYAFTAGLLHDIGRLVLASCFPRHYAAAIACRTKFDCTLLQAEQATLGTDHVQTGQTLAMHWDFSEVIQKAISGHHTLETSGNSSIVFVVHIANSIVQALDLAGVEDDIVAPVSMAVWADLGISENDYLGIFREIEVQFETISHALFH